MNRRDRHSPLRIAAAWMGCLLAGPALAGVDFTKEDALAYAFADTSAVERKTQILSKDDVAQIEKRAGTKVPSRIVSYYVGAPAGANADTLRYVFLETEVLRTLPALLMVALDPGGAVEFVEVLAFHEPEDYRPPRAWFGLYAGRSLEEPWRTGHEIPNIAGSTLSVRGVDRAVRRVLATWELLEGGEPSR